MTGQVLIRDRSSYLKILSNMRNILNVIYGLMVNKCTGNMLIYGIFGVAVPENAIKELKQGKHPHGNGPQ